MACDQVISLATPLQQTQPVAEWVTQRDQTPPVIFMDFTFLLRARTQRPSQCQIEVSNDHVQVQRHPVPAVVALYAPAWAGPSGGRLVQQVERYGCAKHLDDRTVEQLAPDCQPECLLIEGHRGRKIGNVEVEQPLHGQSGLSNSRRETG